MASAATGAREGSRAIPVHSLRPPCADHNAAAARINGATLMALAGHAITPGE